MNVTSALAALALLLPSTVFAQPLERAPQGELVQQWQWAVGQSRQRTSSTGVWVGFSFPRLTRPDHYVFTGPPWTVWSGRFVTHGIPLQDWIERGGDIGDAGPARSVTLDRPAARGELVIKQIAVILALPAGAADVGRIERAELRDVSLPFDPEGRPLIWLGEHETRASLQFLRRLYEAAPIEKVREDVVMAAGLHDHPAEVVEFLDRVLQGDQSDRVRDEAVSALAHFPD